MLSLPRNWSEVTLAQYQELLQIRKLGLEQTTLLVEQLALLADVAPDDEVFEEMSVDELFDLMKTTQWLYREPNATHATEIENLKLKKFEHLALGEFIDLEHWFQEDWLQNAHLILAILYKKFTNDSWGNEIEEPYIYDLNDRSKIFLEKPVTDVWFALRSYLEFKEAFLKSYADLFVDTSEAEEDNEYDNLSSQERLEIRKAEAEEKIRAKWSWESILWSLTNGDVTRYEELFKTKLILVFNVLSMRKSLNL